MNVRFFGNFVNQTTRYYWVQALFDQGRTVLQSFSITGPTVLDQNNFDEISWEPVPGAIGYDVLVTSTGTSPTGTSTIGLALGTQGSSVRNVGQALSSWTQDTAVSSISSTSDVPEGSNLYHTTARVSAIIAALFASKQSVIAAGTLYTVTATQTAVAFGTTSPAIVLPAAGSYLLLARARVDHVGATYAANRTVTLKLRRTNNTPADVAGTPMVIQTGILTTVDQTAGNIFAFAVYTTTLTNDAIALFAGIDVIASAGDSKVADAVIVAVRLT